MNIISVKDKSFSKEKSNEYSLSIQLSLNGFSYLVYSITEELYKAFYFSPLPSQIIYDDFIDKAGEFLEQDIFSAKCNDVKILYSSFQNMLLPEAVYNPDKLKSMFEVGHSIKEDEALMSTKLFDSYQIFTLPSYLSSLIVNKFERSSLYHHTYPIIKHLYNKCKNVGEDHVWVQIMNGYFDIIVFRKSKLLLMNSFRYKNVNDYIYFVMNVFEQLKLKPLSAKVTISGRISLESAYYQSTKTFIQNVDIAKPGDSFEHANQGLIDRQQFQFNTNLFLL